MKLSADELMSKTLDFMTILHECYINTSYAQDRSVYAHDIAMAMGWIVELRKSDDLNGVVENILSINTDKYFGDYWRQGEWGEKHSKAFGDFKNSIKN